MLGAADYLYSRSFIFIMRLGRLTRRRFVTRRKVLVTCTGRPPHFYLCLMMYMYNQWFIAHYENFLLTLTILYFYILFYSINSPNMHERAKTVSTYLNRVPLSSLCRLVLPCFALDPSVRRMSKTLCSRTFSMPAVALLASGLLDMPLRTVMAIISLVPATSSL